MIRKLEKMPYAQAQVEISHDGQLIILRSYKTTVATVINEWLVIHGLYSMTTRKHISAFVREYCGIAFATAKHIYENHLEYNINTGEVRSTLTGL